MLQNPSSRLPDDVQTSKEAGDTTGQQTPIVGLPTTPRRTCSIHKGGYCCLASPQFQDFIAGYALGSSFVGDSEQLNSSSSSAEPASTILTTSASASGSTLDVLTTAAAPPVEGVGVSSTLSAVPLVAESVSSSSSEGTMKTNLTIPDISARTRGKLTSIMVKHMPTDASSPSLSPGLPPTNHSAPSLSLTPTSVLSYTPTPVSTLAYASRSLHDLPSSSSIAAATAFANLTPKARRRTLDSLALADENAARRDWKAINPPYKPETLPSRFGGSPGNLRRATISGSGGMSYYGMGRDASAARWSKLMEAAKTEDDARAGLSRALNNEGTRPKPVRRKTVQIYEPIKSSPLVPKPSPPPSPPPKEDMVTTSTDTLSLPASSVSVVSPAPSLSTITTQSQTVPSVVVSSAEADSTPATQQQSSSPPVSAPASVSVPAVHPTIPPSPSGPPPEPPKEVTLAVKLFGPPSVPVPALRAQMPQGQVKTVSPASVPPPSPLPPPLAAPPIQAPSPSTQAVLTVPAAPVTTAAMPASVTAPQTTTVATMAPSTAPTVTLPTPTNHVHLSRRTYIPPYKHTSFFSRLFSPFSHSHGSHGNSSTASHSTSVLQPPTFTSTKHPPSSASNGASGGGGLGRDITGTFVIDPLLVLPKGLFRAFSDDTFVGLSSTPTPSSEFIGGGGGNRGVGIEGEMRRSAYWDGSAVDIGVGGGLRLKRSRSFDGSLPTPNRGAFSRYHHHHHHEGVNGPGIAEAVGDGRNDVGKRGGEKEKEKKNLKLEVENGGIDVDVHVIPTPIGTTNIVGRRMKVQGPESGLQKKRTTIELSLLSPTINNYEKGRGRGRGGKSGQQQVPEFSLIARIHTKSPRQPIHITARTYTPPPRSSSPVNESAPATLAMSSTPSQPPNTKLVTSQLSPPPPPPPPPPTHPRTSPLPLSTSPIPTAAVDRPPSPASSVHTTRTTQTTYTARTTITNITTPTATAPTETGTETEKGATGPKRSASTGRKLKKKRPSQKQKRMPTLTPYYYASADEAVAADGEGVVGGGVEGIREGVKVETGIGVGGGEGGGPGVEETSAPPYTQTHVPHESSEAADRRPPDPYDLTGTPNTTYANNPPPTSPTPVPALTPAPLPPTSRHDSVDNKNHKNLKKSNSKKQPLSPSVMDNSNLTLSIPRTFHGPLSIHVRAGNLDEHIELSDALQRECVLVKEGRHARGLFVGDFRKEFDWGGGMDAKGTEGMEGAEGRDESEEEEAVCTCGAGEEEVGEVREVEVERKAKVRVRVKEERKVKRKPVVEFSTTTTDGNANLNPGSEESNPVGSTPQMTTLHTRAKSTPPFSTSLATPTPPTHSRSRSIPPSLPFPSSSTDPSSPQQLQPHRPSFLDVDPESLIHRTNSGGSNGLGQIGWKMTKVQNVNGRVRVLSEHQPIMKSPLQNGGALAPVPPVPPLPKGQGQTQTPAWVVPRSGLPGNGHDTGSVKERQRSITSEDGDGEIRIRRLSIERKVFNPLRGWEDSGPPTRTHVNAKGEAGGGDAEDSSSSGGGGGGGSVEDVKRRRRASAPATSTMMTGEEGKRKCTCGARIRTRPGGGKMRNGDVDASETGRTEWMGDRADISIGRGKVRLLYDDESVDVFMPIGGVGAIGIVKKEKKKWWRFGKGG